VVVSAVRGLLQQIGLADERLARYGVSHEELRTLAENSFSTMGGLYKVTPATMTDDDAVTILEDAYA
jgi:alcohol dehydrogenase class IV